MTSKVGLLGVLAHLVRQMEERERVLPFSRKRGPATVSPVTYLHNYSTKYGTSTPNPASMRSHTNSLLVAWTALSPARHAHRLCVVLLCHVMTPPAPSPPPRAMPDVCTLCRCVTSAPARYNHKLAFIVVVDKENHTQIAMQALLETERHESFVFLMESFKMLIRGSSPQVKRRCDAVER